eukprot:13806870-Alexandrium_andersonii.AAC.1
MAVACCPPSHFPDWPYPVARAVGHKEPWLRIRAAPDFCWATAGRAPKTWPALTPMGAKKTAERLQCSGAGV